MTADDIAALCARLDEYEDADGFNRQLAAALRECQQEIARLKEDGPQVVRRDGSLCTMREWAVEQKQRAERAEAEVARLKHPTAAESAIAAGDGTLHGAIDHWHDKCLAMQTERDAARAEADAAQIQIESFRGVLKDRDAMIVRLQKSHTEAWNASVRDGERIAAARAEADAQSRLALAMANELLELRGSFPNQKHEHFYDAARAAGEGKHG